MRKAETRTIADLLAGGEPLLLPGTWDALSAKLAVDAGFPVVFLSGYCLSATRFGEPDVGVVAQADVLDAARRVCAAVDVPVIVDIDTGYGDALAVERTVRELVRAGAAGCFLEDQEWPKRCGHMEGKRVVPLDVYLPKLRAALAVARASGVPFHVTARTDARAVEGLDAAITRARAFAAEGADAVFVEAPASVEEMDAVRRAVPAHVPLVANMVEHGKTPLRPARVLAAAGYQIVAIPVAALLGATRTLRDVYGAMLRDGASAAVSDRLLGFHELNALLGLEEIYRRERAWRGSS
jgi:methylisocitrate lyase